MTHHQNGVDDFLGHFADTLLSLALLAGICYVFWLAIKWAFSMGVLIVILPIAVLAELVKNNRKGAGQCTAQQPVLRVRGVAKSKTKNRTAGMAVLPRCALQLPKACSCASTEYAMPPQMYLRRKS
jgi:hypothetical protein